MFSFDGMKPVDLSPRIKARAYLVDGTIQEGNLDPNGKPWVMVEGRFPGDNSLFKLFRAPPGGDHVWPQERQTMHHGAHVQGGGGHISHWFGVPSAMKGLWQMPADTFMGPAAVCNLTDLNPLPAGKPSSYPRELWLRSFPEGRAKETDLRGQAICTEHLLNVEVGDIVLLTSPFEDLEQPWLTPETCQWLVEDRKIKLLGIGPGILWRYQEKLPAPNNSPVKRIMLGANVPIVHPLVNINSLTKARVFYISMPLRMTKMEASFTRAIALEEV